ncbi:MAG TPA: hypothetical protein VF550_14300 [Polyangia bacterium]
MNSSACAAATGHLGPSKNVDCVYVPGPDGIPSFRALPRLRTDEVSAVLQVTRVRILRYLARLGVVVGVAAAVATFLSCTVCVRLGGI